jgi:hypothetical protein
MRRIAAHSVLAAATASKAAVLKATGKSSWRIDRARVNYYRNRIRYDMRLLIHEEWRTFALRDNWINNDASTMTYPRPSSPEAEQGGGGSSG